MHGTRYFVSNKVVNRWNLLEQQTVNAPRLKCFKAKLSRITDNEIGFFVAGH